MMTVIDLMDFYHIMNLHFYRDDVVRETNDPTSTSVLSAFTQNYCYYGSN